MYFDVFISGFGGQGILLAGQLLAEAAMEKGLNVSFFPSYGVEMRGGTASCTVVISDEEVGSPVVDNPGCVIAMNQPSLLRFQSIVKDEGLLIVNSSLARMEDVKMNGIQAHGVPMSKLALELGNPRLTNMVALGAYASLSGAIKPRELAEALNTVIPARNREFIPLNEKALFKGAAYVERA